MLGVLRFHEARDRPATVPTERQDAGARAGTAAGRRWGPPGQAVPAGAGGGRAAATPGTW